jgi:hypothetical protein
MSTVVIENPDNIPCIGVDEKNPYKHVTTVVESNETPVYFGSQMLFVSPITFQRAVELEKIAMILKSVSLFGIFSNAIFFSLTLIPSFIFGMFMDLVGFAGVQYYNKTCIISYGLYEFFTVCMCIYSLVNLTTSVTGYIVFSFGIVFHGILVRLSYKFVRMFPQVEDD